MTKLSFVGAGLAGAKAAQKLREPGTPLDSFRAQA
jgi:predicted NAD/FAD-dependent oxidoreductase